MHMIMMPANDSRLVRHSPALLLYHEDTLAPRIEFIKRLFPESPRLLSRAPLLLTHDPETFLMPKIHQLESLLPGIDVLKVVRWAGSCTAMPFVAACTFCLGVRRHRKGWVVGLEGALSCHWSVRKRQN